MTVARFIEWALYHPEYGYYSLGPKIGRTGDFTTSPEASPAFGALMARHVADIDQVMGRPPIFDIIECGPGRGTLALHLLDTLKVEHAELYSRVEYSLVEISPALRREQQDRLQTHQQAARWFSRVEEIAQGAMGAVIGNEFLDALPVHVLEARDGTFAEQFVVLDSSGKLYFTLGPLSEEALTDYVQELGITLLDGERLEVNLMAESWLRKLNGVFGRGVVTLIDYGDVAPGRYSPARLEGTLLGYSGGRVTRNILEQPGTQDITALVDFTAVLQAANRHGFAEVGFLRQAAFLVGLGLGTRITPEIGASTVEEALAKQRGLQALVSMEGLGRFHVLLLAKGLEPSRIRAHLSGLNYDGVL